MRQTKKELEGKILYFLDALEKAWDRIDQRNVYIGQLKDQIKSLGETPQPENKVVK